MTFRISSLRDITSPITRSRPFAAGTASSRSTTWMRAAFSLPPSKLPSATIRSPLRGSPRIMPWLNSASIGSSNRLVVSRPIASAAAFVASKMPQSRIALVKKRVYIRCIVACSMPPVYWSTGSQ